MGKNLHNDDFEDFFKKHLEGFDGEPADDMWERIEPVIPPKPGIAWSAYAMPSALILTLGLLVFVGLKMFEYKKTSEDLTEKLEQSSPDIKNGIKAIETIENKSLDDESNLNSDNLNRTKPTNQTTTKISTLNIDNVESSTTKTNELYTKNTITKTPNNVIQNTNQSQGNNTTLTTKTNYEQTINKSQIIENPILPTLPKINESVIETNEETSSNANNKPIAKVDKTFDWKLLAMKPSSIMTKNNWQLNNTVFIEEEFIEEKLTNRNSVTLFIAPTIIKNNIRPPAPPKGNNPPPPPPNNPRPRPIPTEKVKLGQAIGVKYGYDLTDKLTLNIGGMYANASYDFNTRHYLPYNKDTEEDISTDKAGNTVDYSGSSTYGEYSIDVDVTRLKDNDVTQDEEIDIKIDATAKIHSIIVPTYLTYELFEVNGFSLGLKGGMSYNNVIHNDLKINDFKIEKQGFEVEDVRLKKQPKPSKNGTINTLSGVVLAYNIQDKWSFVVEPTWSSAISDNHKADFGRTKSNIFNVDIGLKYNF